MAGKTLRDLVAEREEIDAFLLMQEGELDEELEKTLTDNSAAIDAKVERIGLHVIREEQKCEAIDAEIKRLQARKQTIENRVDWLKNYYLADCLLKLGRSVKTGLVTVRSQQNNPRLDGEVSDERLKQLYEEDHSVFVLKEVTYKLDKRNLLGVAKAQPAVLERFGMTIVRDDSVRVS